MLELIAENLPILLCGVIGVGLLVVEAFMPGFGLPGISGIILQVVSVALTWVEHGPVAALGATLIVLSVDAIAISLALHSATKGKLSKSKLILRDTESNEAGYRSNEDMEVFLGKEGTTITRQTGEVEWTAIKRTHDGRYQAVADEGQNGFDATKAATFLESVYEPAFTEEESGA